MQPRMRSAMLGLAGFAALAFGLAVALQAIDLAPLAGWYGTRLAARPVTVARAHLGWSDGLSVELSDVRIGNPPGATAPDLLRVEAVSAVIAPASLLPGETLQIRRVLLDKPVLGLERAADGKPNWRTDGAPPRQADPAEKRRGLPTILDLALRGGAFVYRGTGGGALRLDLDRATIRADDPTAPIGLTLDGRFNGTVLRVEATGESYAALHDAARPFGTRLTVTTPASSLHFAGSMTAPLDLDGAQGRLRFETHALGELLAMLGLDVASPLPVTLAGTLDRQGDRWHLASARGRVAGNPFDGDLQLDEGARGEPDALAITLRFDQLDLMSVLAAQGRAEASDMSLQVDPRPGVTLDARIAAARLTAFGAAAANLELQGRLLPGEALVDVLGLALAGGRLTASLAARSDGSTSRLTARAVLAGGDVAQLTRLAGLKTGELAGRLDAGITLDGRAATASAALAAARGHAVVAMTRGRVTRDLLEIAATDLRALFRRGQGWTDLRCLLATVELSAGQAAISPMRLRTADTSLVAAGHADLVNRRLDITLKSDRAPGLFALQVPLRLQGAFDALEVKPQLGSAADWLDMPERNAPLRRLPPELARLTLGNPCVN